jgi:hypothetical protein
MKLDDSEVLTWNQEMVEGLKCLFMHHNPTKNHY